MSANLHGTGKSPVDFRFDSFQFANSDILFLECSVALCVLDETGKFQNPSCGWDQSSLVEKCANQNDGKTWGYKVPTSFS